VPRLRDTARSESVFDKVGWRPGFRNSSKYGERRVSGHSFNENQIKATELEDKFANGRHYDEHGYLVSLSHCPRHAMSIIRTLLALHAAGTREKGTRQSCASKCLTFSFFKTGILGHVDNCYQKTVLLGAQTGCNLQIEWLLLPQV